MKKLSSDGTVLHKKIFPVVGFGICVATAIMGSRQARPILYVAPAVVLVMGYVLMKRFVWDLVDEVYDGGDFLIIKKGGREQRLPLVDIVGVTQVPADSGPTRITLFIRNASGAGAPDSVAFLPKHASSLNPFTKDVVFQDLVARTERARAGRQG